jgi:SprT-like family protein
MRRKFEFKPQSGTRGEPINETLKEHALSVDDWPQRKAVAAFHEWASRFNREFHLDLELPVIGIDKLPIKTYGTYHPKRNGFGMRHEIVLNERHLERPLAQQLSVLLHEMVHQWQEQFGRAGKNGFHNLEFRVMAHKFGLVVDDRGHDLGVEPGLFTKLLAKHNIDFGALPIVEDTPVFVANRPRGTSKSKKWSCHCTNVRCAVTLRAQCLKCGAVFEKVDPD